jgi:diaminopimelate decarboxylase
MNVPKVTPVIHPRIKDFLSDSTTVDLLINTYNSPVNMLFPELAAENCTQFQEYFRNSKLNGSIFYAHKANRSYGLLQEIARTGVGIEVSSIEELHNALEAQVPNEKIIANGPKNSSYLQKAIQNGCFICTDSISELKEILNTPGKHKILLRFSNFFDPETPMRSLQSRFGIPYENANDVCKLIVENQEKIDTLGLSFHIDSTSDGEKRIALQSLLRLIIKWKTEGIDVQAINIGGGYRINYIEDKKQWEYLLSVIQSSVISGDPYLWNNHSFGYYIANGRIRGEGSFYPYYTPVTGTNHLDTILTASLPEISTSAKQLIQDLMLEILIEPGRALLDQVGITLMNISQVEKKQDYYKIILDGNYKHITADQDILVDPVLITKDKRKSSPSACFLFGNLCLENDVIFRRQLLLPFEPKKDDIFAFINTAAYKMDFSESKFIHHTLPQRLLVKTMSDQYTITPDLEKTYDL